MPPTAALVPLAAALPQSTAAFQAEGPQSHCPGLISAPGLTPSCRPGSGLSVRGCPADYAGVRWWCPVLLPAPVLCLLAAETGLLLCSAVAATVAAAQEKKRELYALQRKEKDFAFQREEKFTLFSHHNGSLLRRQPADAAAKLQIHADYVYTSTESRQRGS